MTPTEMTTIRNADALTLHATDTRLPREYRAAGTWLVIRPAWTDRGALQTYGVVSAHETRTQALHACVNQCLAQQAQGGRATDRVAEVVA